MKKHLFLIVLVIIVLALNVNFAYAADNVICQTCRDINNASTLEETTNDNLETTAQLNIKKAKLNEQIALESFDSTSILINEFDIYDFAASIDGSAVFMTGTGNASVFRYNVALDKITSLSMPYNARELSISPDGFVFVVLANTEQYTDTIGIIDPTSFTLITTFDVALDGYENSLKGVAADNEYIYAYYRDGVVIFSRTNYELVSSNNLRPEDLQINQLLNQIYVTRSGEIRSFNVVDGQMISHGSNYSYGGTDITIMPDGQHLMLNDGTVLSCSTNPSEDLEYTTKLDMVNNTAANQASNELYTSYNEVIYVYNASDFNFIKSFAEPALVSHLLCGGGNIFFVLEDRDGNTLIHSSFTDAMLKTLHVDGEPFRDFYPACFEIDRGEVPNSTTSINLTAEAAEAGAVISGDTGVHSLSVGENIFNITVTGPISGITETYSIKFTRLESAPPSDTYNAFTELGFTPYDMMLDPDRAVAYMTEVDGKSLYRIDLETGEIQEKQFDVYAEHIAVKNNKIYVTLRRRETPAPLFDDGYENSGAVAIVDTAAFKTETIFELFSYTTDIVTDEDGRPYVWSSKLTSYDTSNGKHNSFYITSSGGYLYYNSKMSKIYSMSNYKPDRIYAYEVSDGIVDDSYESDRFSSSYLSSIMEISPDGEYLFNGRGPIFKCAADQSGDMIIDGYLDDGYNSICFDLANDAFYTASNRTFNAYRYSTRQMQYTMELVDELIGIHFDGSDIVSLQKKSTGEYYVDFISPDGKNSDLSDLSVSAGTLSPAFDTNTEEYSLLLAADTQEVTITPVLSDSGASFEIGNVANTGFNLSLENGESSLITVKVASADGTAEREYVIQVYRQTDDGTFIFDQNYIIPAEKVANPDYPAVYMIGAKKSFVYKVDEEGIIAALPLPYEATSVGYAKDVILVAIQDVAFHKEYIAVVEAESFTLIDTFEVDKLYTGFAGDSDYFYMCDEYTIDVYSKDTYDYISNVFLHEPYYMIPNETTGRLYVSGYWGIMSYSMSEGNLTLESAYDESYMTSGMEIMPDGKHIVLRQGRVLKCSADTEQDLKLVTSIITDKIRFPATNSSANELYMPYDRLIFVYDASDFSFKRVIAEPTYIDYLLNGECTFVTESYGLENPTMRSVRPEALLKTLLFDGEPFSEFFPMQMEVDKGEVPFAKSGINITAIPAVEDAVVKGETGLQFLNIGENILEITVTNTDTSESATYSIKIIRRASDPQPTVYNAFDNLKLTPLDMALDPDRPVAYMTGEDRNCLYRIDLETGDIQIKEFELQAERLTVLNGKVYLTLMRHEHVWNTYSEGYGSIAVIDTATFKVQNYVEINIDPYDVEANDLGYIYIAPGSNQGCHLSIYDSVSGNNLQNRRTIYQKGYIDYNVQLNKLYYIDQGISPRGMVAFVLIDGLCIDKYSWPYFHDYDGVTADLCVSPDGSYIFNGSGWVFKCLPEQAGDMTYYGDIGNTYTSICFDLPNNRFYTSENNTLTIYEYDTLTILDTRVFSNQLVMLKHDGEKIIAVQKDSGVYYINGNLIALDNADLSNIDFSRGDMIPVFDADTLEYDVLVGSTISETVVDATSEDRAATIRINGEVLTSKTIALEPGETCDVIIEVTAQDGITQKTYTVHVTREDSNNADLSDIILTEGTLSQAFEADVIEYDLLLPNNITSTRVTPIKADGAATVRIDGVIGTNKAVYPEPGESINMTIEVTAPDNETKKTYTLVITREAIPVTGVDILQSALDLIPNQTEPLTVVISPSNATNQKIQWISSNEGVATIEDGVITTISQGNTIITATTEDGGYTDSCSVTVTQPVAGIEISEENHWMVTGDNVNITAEINPLDATNKNVTWSSSNESVALVDGNGIISAVSSGTATITVRTQDGGFTDACTVTVKSAELESAIYTIGSDGTINGIEIDTTIDQLIANLDNDSADIKIFDKSGNEVTSGVLCTGMTVKLIIDGTVRYELTIIILGDANGDGSISITDYTLTRLDILGLKDLGQTAATAADINGDGVVSITDYTLMRLDILGLKKIH